jgi:hypothetical protein
MADENDKFCPGEILYASSYGGVEDYIFTNSIAVTPTWLEAVKERMAVLCEASQTLWIDFELNSAMVMFGDQNSEDVDANLLFARKYCYRKFCETYCGYFGMTEIFGFIYRIFSHRHKDPPDEYDMAYAEFVDSLLEDVRFIVCIRRPDLSGNRITEVQNNGNSIATTAESIIENNNAKARTRDVVPLNKQTCGSSTSSKSDDYFEDDLLNMEFDEIDFENRSEPPSPSPTPPAAPAESTAKKGGACKRLFSDYFVNSPLAAEIAPETSLQDRADANETEVASMGRENMFSLTPTDQDLFNFTNDKHNYPISRENTFKATSKIDRGGEDRFARMPVMILYDSVTRTERVLGYEQRSAEKYERNRENTFYIMGLFDESAPRDLHHEVMIEITYAVGPLGGVLSFNAIDVNNIFLKTTGDRGCVMFELSELVQAIRSHDSGARLLDEKQLDLYSFDVDLSSINPDSLLKRKRKFYLWFSKRNKNRPLSHHTGEL